MVPPETPRKRLRFLVILILAISLTGGTAHAASKTAKPAVKKVSSVSASTKKTTTKTVAKKSAPAKTSSAKASASHGKTTKTKAAPKGIIKKVKGENTIADKEATIALPPSDLQSPEVAYPVVSASAQSAQVALPTITTILRDGYWMQPIEGQLSQGIHDNNAVDIRAPIGTAVHAAAAGTVTLAKEGYNGGYGNYIIIAHPNGTETLYAHLSQINVTVGQSVAQLQVIGLSGVSGRVTGAHLHFEIHNAFNPWGNDPLGTNYTI